MGQKKYPDELRERATRMTLEALADPARAKGAIRRIADELGVHPEALRTWVKKAPELHRLGWFVFQGGVFRWDGGGGVVVSGH